jgi:hypothetical protein
VTDQFPTEHLQAVIDGLQVGHETALGRIEELRLEKERLVSALQVVQLYVDSVRGRNGLRGDSLITHIEAYLEEFRANGWW